MVIQVYLSGLEKWSHKLPDRQTAREIVINSFELYCFEYVKKIHFPYFQYSKEQ